VDDATLLCSRDASALPRAIVHGYHRAHAPERSWAAPGGMVLRGIAHDFNNIPGAILGFGEMAQRGAALGNARGATSQHHDASAAARCRRIRLCRSGASVRHESASCARRRSPAKRAASRKGRSAMDDGNP
jgi:hypothetical protein